MDRQDNQADDVEMDFTEAVSSQQDALPISVDEGSIASASELSTASDAISRRASRRSRRMVHNSGSFVTETELEALLTEPSEQPAVQSSGRGNIAGRIISEEYETWVCMKTSRLCKFYSPNEFPLLFQSLICLQVEVEQILRVRRTAPFPGQYHSFIAIPSWFSRLFTY